MKDSDFLINPIRISLVEDDEIIREGFSVLLNQTPKFNVVSTYGNCEDFLKNINHDKPQVVLMDIELPGMNGIEGIEKAKKINPKIQVIVVTVYENDDLVFKALCAGAGGYLTKNVPSQYLSDAIFEIINGGAPMSTNIARKVVASFQKNHHSPLSGRETEVLELLAKGKSYSNIAEELFVEKETVRTHIKNIYWKLEVHSKAEALEKAKKEKYIS
jgi:DNA-binding NarL/FixJ family response regulator